MKSLPLLGSAFADAINRPEDLPCFARTTTTDARESASPHQRIPALYLRRRRGACGISVTRVGEVDAGGSPLLWRSKDHVRESDGARLSIGYDRLEVPLRTSRDSG